MACINGSFCPLAEATISVEDRGLQFADGVYEVIAAPAGVPFMVAEHLARLRRSLAGIDLAVDSQTLGVESLIVEGIRRSDYAGVVVYIQITGGTAARNHVRSEVCTPNLVMTFRQLNPIPPERFHRGVALESTRDTRWAKPCIKSTALLPNILLRRSAMQRGFDDALLIGPVGEVRETTCANLFAVFGDTLWTSPVSDHILRGITRDFLLEHATRSGAPANERNLSLDELLGADEVFVTSTTQEAMPVIRIDEQVIGNGQPGPRTIACAKALRNAATGATEMD